jgi:hypothetical protein
MIRREFLIFGEKRNCNYKNVISEGYWVKGKRHEVRAMLRGFLNTTPVKYASLSLV